MQGAQYINASVIIITKLQASLPTKSKQKESVWIKTKVGRDSDCYSNER